jgi:hypothetical protein
MSERNERLYTEKQVAKILRQAGELQAAHPSEPTGRGVTEQELFRIAEEVGLQRSHVEQAISRHDDGDEAQTRLLGAPPSYEFERVVEGELTEDRWQAIVGELNAHFHQSIEGIQAGPVHTWHWKHSLGSVHLAATRGAGSFRLRLVAHIDDGIAVAMVPTICFMLLLAGLPWTFKDWHVWAQFLFTFTVPSMVGLWFRKIVGNWYRRDRFKLSRLMNRLVEASEIVANAQTNPLRPIEEEVLRQGLTEG